MKDFFGGILVWVLGIALAIGLVMLNVNAKETDRKTAKGITWVIAIALVILSIMEESC